MKSKFLTCFVSVFVLMAILAGCTATPRLPTLESNKEEENSQQGDESNLESTEFNDDVTESEEENSQQGDESNLESTEFNDDVTESEEDSEAPAIPNESQKPNVDVVNPYESKIPDMEILGEGYDIYRVTNGYEWGYRYGCTYLYNDDGSVNAYFACVESEPDEWDWISYMYSPDGGETWENEKIVLTPTKGSLDHFSNCDPAVVYFGGYYYLGYTSTLNSSGACNNLFVARSKNPDGPFEKWNGNGWGGDKCEPIVYYKEDYSMWGIGEPSFIELNGTLYIYYTNTSPSGDYMMVATADATKENWPLTLKNHGVACLKPTDSLDVKYIEEWGKFVGIATGERRTTDSWLGVYESNDGLKFELADVVREGTYARLHNAGFSSRPNGHIKISEDASKLCVIYAYGEVWGQWNTRVQPISLSLTKENDINAEKLKPCLDDPKNRNELIPAENRYVTMIRPEKDSYYCTKNTSPFDIALYKYDTYFEKTPLTESGASFEVYNKNVVTIKNSTVTVVGVGTTGVEVTYKNCKYLFYITVTENEINSGASNEAVDFLPVYKSCTIYIGERSRFHPQLRARMLWADGSFTEYYCDESDVQVTYSGYDNSIISVNEKGIVTAKKVGETSVTITCNGRSCTIKIKVTNNIKESFFSVGLSKEDLSIDYANLDFSVKENLKVIFGLNQALVSYDDKEKALKATVKGEDAFFTVMYNQNTALLTADKYKKIEITYMVPTSTSAKATELQMFLCAGDNTSPNPLFQTKTALERDGLYHSFTVDATQFSCWNGDIYSVRIDFFDQSSLGDSIYIKSIKLLNN